MEAQSFITLGDGTRLAYRFDGPPDKPTLMLSNSISTTHRMWDREMAALTAHFRVLRYDMRGHGASGVPAGAYSLARLGRDVVELLDALALERVHFLGLSLGGFVGQWLGIHVPERIDRLVLSNTSAYLGPAEQWDRRIEAVLAATDLTETANMFLHNWFPASMLRDAEPVVETFRAMLLAMNPQGLAGSYAAVRDTDLRRTIALVERPTLVIAGRDDTVTAATHSELIAATIPDARLVVLPTVHLPNIERPREFLDAVLAFLSRSLP
ncbi:alpha/beta fold hydrolase [Trinickia caryophylli]|uniref:3-oxoadipate enol-lactonase n=1 Tax=Trinickia caryophylli TaxID=28094 RepID=A0A1X7G745_TRICW|nr:alpha/beta fold hydrolase [Trinickia caryophylli]PMS11457.1 3-oxoadipate enol-lactonase [Trinickia caryophylli]TRX17656.1 alpha/beta fold hydrolase [Trinickia caryophylli]WQE11585.1 alpha/beta fold hydrolase [Trinickia caryophylli]SMF65224.1 3-oxoadipate enol-lactonase [Trinickia caryophylli]GLU34761.1 3-oxoadipate enol-lactonase [Trinickia caryophylli]